MSTTHKYWSTEEFIMLEVLFWVGVGAFVGWNLPQPWYAKAIQDKVMSVIRGIGKKDTAE